MTFEELADARWAERRAHFGEAWVGKPPLREAQDECIDMRNYAMEASRRGEISIDEADLIAAIAKQLHGHLGRLEEQSK